MSRKPTNGRLYENCRAVAADVARRPTSGRREDNAACGCVAPCHAMPARFAGEARRADRWSAALNPGAMAADVSRKPTNGRRDDDGRADCWRHAMQATIAARPVEPTVGRLLSTEAPWQPTCHGSRPTVGSTKIVVPWQPTWHGSRPTVGSTKIVVPWQPTWHGSRPTVGSTKIVVPWRPTCHGSRPTVGSTKLWCRGSRRGTAADQRSALPRGVVSAAA